MTSNADLTLADGFTFARLFELEGLQKLDTEFLARVRARDAALHRRLLHYRESGGALPPTEVSELLLACAPILEQQIAQLFRIEEAHARLRRETLAHDPVFVFKKQYVLKRARRRLAKKEDIEDFAALDAWLAQALRSAGANGEDRELAIARFGERLLTDEVANSDAI